MLRKYHMIRIICVSIAVILLASCGQNVTTGTTAVATATTQPGSPATFIPTKLPASPTTTPSTAKTPASTAPSGSVTLSIEPVSPRTHMAFVVTISNHTGQTIYFPDHLTNCTVILLEHQVAGNWQPINLCKLMILTRLLPLNTRQNLAVKLLPSLSAPGLYRASIRYSTSPRTALPTTVYSAAFTISA
ncbi:MAG: hypothetical protein H0W02_22785 [Ktedonobacteraceae bacterium]|nr:hypothetical protein [Ktedonobacteraceae bacterium]